MQSYKKLFIIAKFDKFKFHYYRINRKMYKITFK